MKPIVQLLAFIYVISQSAIYIFVCRVKLF